MIIGDSFRFFFQHESIDSERANFKFIKTRVIIFRTCQTDKYKHYVRHNSIPFIDSMYFFKMSSQITFNDHPIDWAIGTKKLKRIFILFSHICVRSKRENESIYLFIFIFSHYIIYVDKDRCLIHRTWSLFSYFWMFSYQITM